MIDKFYSNAKKINYLRSGPLGEHIDNFSKSLLNKGYSNQNLVVKIRAVGRLSNWMSFHNLGIENFSEKIITKFLEDSHLARNGLKVQSCALGQFLDFLRSKEVLTAAKPKHIDTRQPIEKEFSDYLVYDRGISKEAIRYQLLIAHRFLKTRFGTDRFDCDQLCASDVIQFTLNNAYKYKLRSSQTMLSALKCFLRFLYMRGKTPTNLTGCIHRVANWRLSSLPTFLESEQVEKLLACVDQSTRIGIRDYAILLLLVRLGLRGGEVVNLTLEDIDWDAGSIIVRGKSDWHNPLPLTEDVGESIAKYLRYSRPKCSCRQVFIRYFAPYKKLANSSAITSLVNKYLKKADLNPARKGAHLLRYSFATRMIQQGNTLSEIGGILGHQFHSSTEIYAKVAIPSLRELAKPWPGKFDHD